MAKKVFHDFGESPTVNKFRGVVGGEWLDSQNVPQGTKIYQRNSKTGECFHVGGITVEESGVYIEAGAESNPQGTAEIPAIDNGIDLLTDEI